MQQRTLVRARDLGAFRAALIALAVRGGPLDCRRRVVIVPTHAAGELLRQSIEQAAITSGSSGVVLPDLLTREDWVRRLHDALTGAGPLLTRIEREVLLARVARDVQAARPWCPPPFELRPGLVSAMLDFADELKRRQRTVRRFARAIFDDLRGERGTDRGTDSLLNQTMFLGWTFLAFERAVRASGAQDEHTLRVELLRQQPVLPFGHVVVAVADHPTDPRGLWPSDFDLLGRLAGITRIDVVMTDEAHDAGFRDRLERELPGIVETRAPAPAIRPVPPRLVVPATAESGALVFVSRDREDELRAAVRVIRARVTTTGGALREPTAIVFHRPLPYLYLGQQVLSDGRVPYQAFDALPLAAEPYAALLDQVLAVARSGGTRESVVGLLRSTLMVFDDDGQLVSGHDVSALDAVLIERRATGDAASYHAEVGHFFGARSSRGRIDRGGATRAARAAAAIAHQLGPYQTAPAASAQVMAIARFLRRHERDLGRDGAWLDRHRRARAAVLGVLDGMADAFLQHDDAARDHDVLTAAVHHAIEARTFTPRRGSAGVHLVDAVAARFGEFDHVHMVGLVETDWPERRPRNVFYAFGLLKALGWPQDADQMGAEQAAFRDILTLARHTTRLSAFQLEGDAVVALSPMIETARDLSAVVADAATDAMLHEPVFADEVLVRRRAPLGLAPEVAAWLARRRERPGLDTRAYTGFVDPQPARPYKVSRVDHYVDCPFKYFAENVLQLPEERESQSGVTPLERGTTLHGLFERFFRAWQAEGRGTLTAANLPDALQRFARLVDDALATLPEADRALEEMRLLGSMVGQGVAERVFELEVDAGRPVRDRLLEHELVGTFAFPWLGGLSTRQIEIRGKADRVDLFEDGSLAVFDYKLGRMPDLKTSVQVAVYAHCAQQMLERADGRSHPVAEACYLAFGDDRQLKGGLGGKSQAAAEGVRVRVEAFAGKVSAIEAGEFPAKPRRTAECTWCAFAGVCRKEYLVEDDEAADAL